MAARVFAMLLIFGSVFLADTAFAAEWVYLQRHEATRYGACSEYADAASAVRDGDRLRYWVLWVLDGERPAGHPQRLLWHKEVLLGETMKRRYVDAYQYDADGAAAKVNNFFLHKPTDFFPVQSGSEEEQAARRMLEYAREGGGANTNRPGGLTVPEAKWYGHMTFDDCSLFWDVRSIAVRPPAAPTTVDITVRWVWNDKERAERAASLAAVGPSSRWYADLRHTLMVCQFSLTENKMRILSMADFDARGRQMAVAGGSGWADVAPGSKEELVRQIALKWLKSGE